MENTDRLLQGGSEPVEWFVAQGQDWTGPFSVAEVYQKISRQELSWSHLAWKAGMEGWKKLSELPEVLALVPKPQIAPSVQAPSDAKKPSALSPGSSAEPPSLARIWFLYFNETQYGPFSQPELTKLLDAGKITSRVHAWKKGMEKWERLERIPELGILPKSPSGSSPQERRISQRRPMVARILLAHGEEVSEGVCRDVSVGGMQVLTAVIPGKVGTRLKLNIDTRSQAGDPPRPFTAEGLVVRELEDGRGFCFRFEKLEEEAKKAIEEWIQQTTSS